MPSQQKWGALNAARTLITGSSLNSLANGARVLGTSVNPTTDRYTLAYLWLTLGLAANASGAPYVNVWFLKSTDGGTTFEDGDATTAPPRPADYVFNVQTGVTAAKVYGQGRDVIEFPAVHFKVCIENQTGQAFAASGNTLVSVEVNPEAQ